MEDDTRIGPVGVRDWYRDSSREEFLGLRHSMHFVRNVNLRVVLIVFLHSAVWAQSHEVAARADGENSSSSIKADPKPKPKDRAREKFVNPFQGNDADSSYELQPGEDPQNQLGLRFIKHLASDQHTFW